RNRAQKQRLALSRHLPLNPAKVHSAQSTLIISGLRYMLNSTLGVGRWAFDVFLPCSRPSTLNCVAPLSFCVLSANFLIPTSSFLLSSGERNGLRSLRSESLSFALSSQSFNNNSVPKTA